MPTSESGSPRRTARPPTFPGPSFLVTSPKARAVGGPGGWRPAPRDHGRPILLDCGPRPARCAAYEATETRSRPPQRGAPSAIVARESGDPGGDPIGLQAPAQETRGGGDEHSRAAEQLGRSSRTKLRDSTEPPARSAASSSPSTTPRRSHAPATAQRVRRWPHRAIEYNRASPRASATAAPRRGEERHGADRQDKRGPVKGEEVPGPPSRRAGAGGGGSPCRGTNPVTKASAASPIPPTTSSSRFSDGWLLPEDSGLARCHRAETARRGRRRCPHPAEDRSPREDSGAARGEARGEATNK